MASGETGEGLQLKGYLVFAEFSKWTTSESACDEFVGRAWVEGYTNFVGDDGGKDVDGCGSVQGAALSGNGVNSLCLVRLGGQYSHLCCDAL